MRLKTQYASKADLGRDIQAQRPDLAGQDPVAVADGFLGSRYGSSVTVTEAQAAPEPEYTGPTGYTDISPLRALSNIPGDALTTIGENVAGLGQLVAHPLNSIGDMLKVGGGTADVLANKVGIPLDIASPQSEQAARSMGNEFLGSLSPEGLQERPVRALSNALMALSPRSLLGALGKAGKVGRAAMITEDVLNNPVGAGLGVARSGVRAAGNAGRRAMHGLSEATTGKPTGLGTDVRDAIVGFTTGQGARSAGALFDVAADPGQARVFEEYRNAARARSGRGVAAQDHIIEETLRARDRMRDTNSAQYAQYVDNAQELDLPLSQAVVQKGGQPVTLLDNLRSRLDGELNGQGINLVQKGGPGPAAPNRATQMVWDQQYQGVTDKATWERISAKLKSQGWPVQDFPEPPRWVVKWDENFANIPVGHERTAIEHWVENLANTPEDQTIRSLHSARQALDDIAHTTDPETKAGQVVKVVRGTLGQTLRDFIQDPAFKQEMQRYEAQNAKIDLITQEFSLPLHRVVSKSGVVHYGPGQAKHGAIIGKLKEAYSDTEAKHVRPGLLKVLEDEGGARNLGAKILGYNYEDIFGHGLVQRGQFSGAARAAGTAVISGAIGNVFFGIPTMIGAVASAIPSTIFYSPRLASTLILKLGKVARGTPPNPGKVRRAAAAMQQQAKHLLNDPRTGPYVRAAMREGWSMGKLFEAIQQQGVDVQSILHPEEQVQRKPRRLLHSLSTAGVPYAR